MKILLVEDEPDLAAALAELLRKECYAVDVAGDGQRADELKLVNDYDLVVLDWMIPPPTGIELLNGWRQAGDSTPVLMLTGRSGVGDRVSGLDSGADDYLTKPFSLGEFAARVRSLLRRRQLPLQESLSAGDVAMERATRHVSVEGEPLSLPPKEFAILEYLMLRPEEVVSRSELIEHVWEDPFDPMSNVVDATVYRLRTKIDGGRERKLLHTVKGVGYVLRKDRR